MLSSITPGIWCAEQALRPGGGVVFYTRMTVVDLGDGELLLHSPIRLDAALVEQIEQLGQVRWIVAPNDHHHLFAGPAAAKFPQAQLLGTAGAQRNEPTVQFSALLEDGAPSEWAGRLEMIALAGTRNWNECVFYPVGKGTLICSDLVFNVRESPNFSTDLLLRVIGVRHKLAQSRTQRWLMVRNRAEYARSIEKVLAWDFERIIMAHGRVVKSDGKAGLRRALRWALR